MNRVVGGIVLIRNVSPAPSLPPLRDGSLKPCFRYRGFVEPVLCNDKKFRTQNVGEEAESFSRFPQNDDV